MVTRLKYSKKQKSTMELGKYLTAATTFILFIAASYDLFITQEFPIIYTLIAAVLLAATTVALLQTLISKKAFLAVKLSSSALILAFFFWLIPTGQVSTTYVYVGIGIGLLYVLAILRLEMD